MRVLAEGEWVEVVAGEHAGRVGIVDSRQAWTGSGYAQAVRLSAHERCSILRSYLRPLSHTAPAKAQGWVGRDARQGGKAGLQSTIGHAARRG